MMERSRSRCFFCLADLRGPLHFSPVKSVMLRQAAAGPSGNRALGAGNSGSTAGIPNVLFEHSLRHRTAQRLDTTVYVRLRGQRRLASRALQECMYRVLCITLSMSVPPP